MAYDETLARRVDELLDDEPDLTEKKMFGGLAFMINGNMAVGIGGDSLIVRIGLDAFEAALAEPGVEEFGDSGRPMRGWVLVSPDRLADEPALASWVNRGRGIAKSLPPK
jgi:TfoX/Sxy family transcriptional regulator of competence genes